MTTGLVYYNSYILPDANHALLNLLIAIQRKKPTVELKANTRIDAFKGYTIYFREKNDRTGEIRDVQIVKHAAKGVYPTTINAESGQLKFLQAENVLRFDLNDGEIHELPVEASSAVPVSPASSRVSPCAEPGKPPRHHPGCL